MRRPECGTKAGYESHKRYAEEQCGECQEAGAAYMREYRQRTGGKADRRNSYAVNRTLADLKRLHPGQYRALYDQHAAEWEASNA